jgi:hypothetical protein
MSKGVFGSGEIKWEPHPFVEDRIGAIYTVKMANSLQCRVPGRRYENHKIL